MLSTTRTNHETRRPPLRHALELSHLVNRVTQATTYTSEEAERGVLALFVIYGDLAAVERMVAEFIACARR